MTVTETAVGDLAPPPGPSAAGTEGVWVLPTDDDQTLEFEGKFLGVGSSHRPRHTRHPSDFAPKGTRCPACRWFEPRIFYGREIGSDEPERYLVYFTGASIVPGETPRHRHEWLLSAYEVIEILTTRHTGDTRQPHLTVPAARVLAQASAFDRRLNDAYVNRAVS